MRDQIQHSFLHPIPLPFMVVIRTLAPLSGMPRRAVGAAS
jgi:hypothetical protein